MPIYSLFHNSMYDQSIFNFTCYSKKKKKTFILALIGSLYKMANPNRNHHQFNRTFSAYFNGVSRYAIIENSIGSTPLTSGVRYCYWIGFAGAFEFFIADLCSYER